VTKPQDPARSVKRTNDERRKIAQDACRKVPCATVATGGYPPCPFCPHDKKRSSDETK
jgi:hypothetical protein